MAYRPLRKAIRCAIIDRDCDGSNCEDLREDIEKTICLSDIKMELEMAKRVKAALDLVNTDEVVASAANAIEPQCADLSATGSADPTITGCKPKRVDCKWDDTQTNPADRCVEDADVQATAQQASADTIKTRYSEEVDLLEYELSAEKAIATTLRECRANDYIRDVVFSGVHGDKRFHSPEYIKRKKLQDADRRRLKKKQERGDITVRTFDVLMEPGTDKHYPIERFYYGGIMDQDVIYCEVGTWSPHQNRHEYSWVPAILVPMAMLLGVLLFWVTKDHCPVDPVEEEMRRRNQGRGIQGIINL